MVTEGSRWRRRLTGRVWQVDKIHERGPLEIEIRLPETGEREAVLKCYLEKHFTRIEEESCPACDGDVTTPHSANCNYARGN